VEAFIHLILTSALEEGDWSASRLDRWNPVQEPPVPTEKETSINNRNWTVIVFILIENQQMHQNDHLLWCLVKRSYMFRRINAIIRELI
jgi:hypothetical protein